MFAPIASAIGLLKCPLQPEPRMRTFASSVPVIIAGVVLSTLHQSSLGTMYLILPHKLHPLWYTPLLPLMFYISAICVGLAMTIFESWHSSRAFNRELDGVQRVARVATGNFN